ncbi:hypothetical protein HOE22_10165 [Candidatus Woesearchaeota archaeon]|jgi:hypothetical protein|nr:hypothetical protein [Candidatus Woesearchaeota archaeon]
MALIRSKQLNHILSGSFSVTGNLNVTGSNTTGSFGRIESNTISASLIDVDATTLRIGGSELNKTIVDNLIGSFADALPNNMVISGSMYSTGSFGKVKATRFYGDGIGLTNISADSINGQLGIFSPTGSIQSTTNNLQITGSMKLTDAFTHGSTTWNAIGGNMSITGSDFIWKSTGGEFGVYDNSDALMFKIENNVAILGALNTTPSATAGGIFYSGSDEWFMGFDSNPV